MSTPSYSALRKRRLVPARHASAATGSCTDLHFSTLVRTFTETSSVTARATGSGRPDGSETEETVGTGAFERFRAARNRCQPSDRPGPRRTRDCRSCATAEVQVKSTKSTIPTIGAATCRSAEDNCTHGSVVTRCRGKGIGPSRSPRLSKSAD